MPLWLESIILKLAISVVMEFMKRHDEDPEFRAKADVVFAEWSASSTTEERRKALKDMHALMRS